MTHTHPNTANGAPAFQRHRLVYTWMADNRKVWKDLEDYDTRWNELALKAKQDGFYAPATTISQIVFTLKRIAAALKVAG